MGLRMVPFFKAKGGRVNTGYGLNIDSGSSGGGGSSGGVISIDTTIDSLIGTYNNKSLYYREVDAESTSHGFWIRLYDVDTVIYAFAKSKLSDSDYGELISYIDFYEDDVSDSRWRCDIKSLPSDSFSSSKVCIFFTKKED